MEQLREVLDAYNATQSALVAKREAIQGRIRMREKQIERLRKSEAKTWDDSQFWGDAILLPVAEAIRDRYFPKHEIELLGPFGMGAKMSIWILLPNYDTDNLKRVESIVWSIEFSPHNLDDGSRGIRHIDTNIDTGRYASGSMGEMNGFNNPETLLSPETTIEEIYQMEKRN